jgi:hypothetical protein
MSDRRLVRGRDSNPDNLLQSHVCNGDQAKRITVTGYAFIDLSHQCAGFPTPAASTAEIG